MAGRDWTGKEFRWQAWETAMTLYDLCNDRKAVRVHCARGGGYAAEYEGQRLVASTFNDLVAKVEAAFPLPKEHTC